MLFGLYDDLTQKLLGTFDTIFEATEELINYGIKNRRECQIQPFKFATRENLAGLILSEAVNLEEILIGNQVEED